MGKMKVGVKKVEVEGIKDVWADEPVIELNKRTRKYKDYI
jgi:hypothetical protein